MICLMGKFLVEIASDVDRFFGANSLIGARKPGVLSLVDSKMWLYHQIIWFIREITFF